MRKKNYSIERKTKILKTLEKDGRVEVETLAKELNVSKETIRRDLREKDPRRCCKYKQYTAVSGVSISDA